MNAANKIRSARIQMETKRKKPKQPKLTSFEETVTLARIQPPCTTSSIYERRNDKKVLKIVTVIFYMLFVSAAAITLSFYYVFIWDPTGPPIRSTSYRGNIICDKKVVVPENLAISLTNATEISAENFFRKIFNSYVKTYNGRLIKLIKMNVDSRLKKAKNKRKISNDLHNQKIIDDNLDGSGNRNRKLIENRMLDDAKQNIDIITNNSDKNNDDTNREDDDDDDGDEDDIMDGKDLEGSGILNFENWNQTTLIFLSKKKNTKNKF